MLQQHQELKSFGKVKNNVPLSRFSTFQIGGPTKFLIEITEEEKLINALNYLNQEGLDYIILGSGSNILFPDQGFDGVVIKIETKNLLISKNIITTSAGNQLAEMVNLANKNILSGMEWATGIPGTVGGAIRGNAGAMGKEIANNLKSVRIWQNGEIKEMQNEECGFNYRHSIFKNNQAVILSANFELKNGIKEEIVQSMQAYLKQRTGRYPTYPSAGSFFQNIDVKNWTGKKEDLPEIFYERGKIPTGWLIEQCDLKGYTIGGAKISDEHGNFIINYNKATQSDILKIVETAQTKVYNKFRINLIPEVEIIT